MDINMSAPAHDDLAITVVRIYLTEMQHNLNPLLHYLHNHSQVRGVTVFRGISGFGHSGKIHSASLLDLSLDLPLVIEFFDDIDKVATMMPYLNTLIAPGHIIYWNAYVNATKPT
jgi:uncharacterized protein